MRASTGRFMKQKDITDIDANNLAARMIQSNINCPCSNPASRRKSNMFNLWFRCQVRMVSNSYPMSRTLHPLRSMFATGESTLLYVVQRKGCIRNVFLDLYKRIEVVAWIISVPAKSPLQYISLHPLAI